MKPPLYQPKLREHHVEIEIMQRLGYAGVKVRKIVERIPVRKKNGKMARTSDPGIPDLVGWVKHVQRISHSFICGKCPNSCALNLENPATTPVYIEVKRPGGERRKMQERFIAEAAADGCIAFFAESWQDVVKGFAAHGIDLSRKGGIEWQPSEK